jgi:SNF2 family DNA or RNA helicase
MRIVEYKPQHQQIAEILGKKGITVPKKAKKQVMDRIATLAPLLTIHSDIAGADSDIKTVKAKQILHVHLQPIDAGLKFSAYIQPFKTSQPLFHPGEGGATVFTEVDQKQVQTHRNLKAEKKVLNQLLQHCPALYQNSQYEWLLDDPELALETLLQLQEFQQTSAKTIKLEWPQGKKITLNNAAEVSQMNVKIGKSQDWFSLTGQLQISDDQVLEMRQLMTLLAQSSGRFIPLGDNQFLALTEELRSRLDAIQAYTSDKGKFHALAIPALDELTEGMKVKASKPWKDQLKRLLDSRKTNFQVPSTLQGELRDYQQEGFQWLARLAHWGAGACLADDMGLGKTMQALALILTRCKQGPTLILAPTSVCSNWETEIFRFAPTLNVKRFGTGDRQKMLDSAGAFDLIICSYGLLQSESERLTKVKWHTIVADEAQAIKNYQAKRTKAAMQLQADFRIITTGTPIENHLGELWSLFAFINPGLLGSLDVFNSRYATPIERDNNPQVRQQLKNLIAPFILRRLKSEVLTELPPRTEITLTVELS